MPMNFRLLRASAGGGGAGPQPPEAPTSLTATPSASSGEGRLQLNWTLGNDNGAAITNHNIQLSTDGGTTWGSSINTGSGTNSRLVSSLPLNTTYHVRVRSVSSAGNSEWSNIAGPATTPTVPSAVPNVTADTSETDISAAEVTWDTPASDGGSAIVQYEILTTQDATAPFTWTSRGVTSTQPFLLTIPYRGGQQYTVDVKAINNAGTGPSALMFSSATLSSSEPPAPTALSVTPQANYAIYFAWDAPPNNGGSAITDYEVEYAKVAGSPSQALTSNTLFYQYTGNLIDVGQTFEFRVRAINSIGSGEWSGRIPVVLGDVPSTPAQPGYRATTESGAVELDITVPANNGYAITSYTVEWDDESTFSTPISSQTFTDQPSVGSAFYRLITGITGGVSYYYRVRFTNSVGNGEYSSGVQVQATATVPGVPDSFAVSPDYLSQEWDFTWNAPFDGGSGITGYEIQESASSDMSSPSTLSPSMSPYSVAIGTPDQTRYFRIRALNSVGTSAWSSVISGYYDTPTAPGAPTINNAYYDAVNDQTFIEYTFPADDGNSAITYYEFFFDGSSTSEAQNNLGAGTGQAMFYQDYQGTTATMKATNSVGQGPASNGVTVT